MSLMDNKLSWTNYELDDLLRQLGLALEASGIGIWQHNVRRNQTRWDEQLKLIYGVPKGPLDVVWLNTVHPDDVAETNAIFLHAIEKKCDYAAQFRIIRADGVVRHLRSRARFFVDAIGDPCFIGAEWDVTEDVLLNEQLAKEREDAEKSRFEARFAADHDYLTGLPNRRSFDAYISSFAQNSNTSITLCHIDIDRFKEINDRFGHAGGDIVLQHFSEILAKSVKDGDVAARLGGDEFAILLKGDQATRSDEVIQVIRSSLAEPLFIGVHPLTVQCSIGIATARADDIERLLWSSDLALYHAKQNGRGRDEIFTETLGADLHAERQTLFDLSVGLSDGQIIPFYQIQVDAQSREISGFEALARWYHPTRGLLSPAAFLDIAISSGTIDQVDNAILSSVLIDTSRWASMGLTVPRVSVNLSASRLSDPSLLTTLSQLQIPPDKISFELIETIFLDSLSDQVKRNIDGIRGLGIQIEIDDLGSGHASMLGMIELRPERVKIDRQLITPIIQSVTQRRLVRSLVDIARALDMEVVAEGVETLEHADVLVGLGIDHFQGYAFGRPEPAAVIETLLTKLQPSGSAMNADTRQRRARSKVGTTR